ncbi:MAG: TrkA family potassium uptake protein [Pyrinomonadaceae bacterium]
MSLTSSAPRIANKSRLRVALFALTVAIASGTLGFHLLEGWAFGDSLYMTVMTITTVGYGEVHPLSGAGRFFASLFMFAGVGTVAYALSGIVQTVVQSELVATFGERRRFREMNKLRDHFIICGAGRVGSHIIREIARSGVPFVVIEQDASKVAALIDGGANVLVRDATLEETLRDAGVERARGLVACLAEDADNVYIALTARDLNRALYIVARAAEEQAEAKLIRAGANRVVAPTLIGGHRMAQALLKPAVHDFIDSIAADDLDLSFEQVEVAPTSALVGHKLRFTVIRSELDVVIVSIRHTDGTTLFNPTGDAMIRGGDVLIAIGRAEAIARLKELARATK